MALALGNLSKWNRWVRLAYASLWLENNIWHGYITKEDGMISVDARVVDWNETFYYY